MESSRIARMTTTGTYLLRDVPHELRRAARGRALCQRTTLGRVLLQGLREYATGTWTPRSDGEAPESAQAGVERDAGRER
jgi:hypothetical protein